MMHACFHGGGSGSKITKSIAVIRDLTKSVRTPSSPPSHLSGCSARRVLHNVVSSRVQMKAMTLKVKGGGERHSRARRRRRRGPTTEDEDPQDKDASSSASSSAKIAPAQPHEEEEHGGEKHEHCDKCLAEEVEEGEGAAAPADGGGSDGEWMAEPEPGVLMTLAPRGDGANYLRRIRFSEDHFPDACAAHAWWAYNYDRIVELYSLVVQSEHASHGEDDDDDPAAPATPCQSEDDEHQQQVRTTISI